MVNNKTVQSLFCLNILIILVLRYPTFSYQCCADTYVMSYLSTLIDSNGNMVWYDNLFSLVGYHPYSYPGGQPVILSMIFSITGISTNASVYLSSLYMSILLSFIIFILSRTLSSEPLFPFVSMFLVSSLPYIHILSWFNGHARFPALVMSALMYYFILKTFKNFSYKYLFLVVIMFLTVISIHRVSLSGFLLLFSLVSINNLIQRFNIIGMRLFIFFFAVGALLIVFASISKYNNYTEIYNFINFVINNMFRLYGIALIPILGFLFILLSGDMVMIRSNQIWLLKLFLLYSLFFNNQYLTIIVTVPLLLLTSYSLVRVINSRASFLSSGIVLWLTLAFYILFSYHLFVSGDINYILILILVYPGYKLFRLSLKYKIQFYSKSQVVTAIVCFLLINVIYDFHRHNVNNIRHINNIPVGEGEGVVFGGTSSNSIETFAYIDSYNMQYITDSNGFDLRAKAFGASESTIPHYFSLNSSYKEEANFGFNVTFFLRNQKSIYDSDIDSPYNSLTSTVNYIFANNQIDLARSHGVSFVVIQNEEYWLNEYILKDNFVSNLHNNNYEIYSAEREKVYYFK